MSLVGNTPLQKNAMNHHGVKEAFFDTFFQKKATAQLSANAYTQSISENFSRFSFTGKERDEETGYGYFGARYMDHELMTMWLSVDPMADKYPSISPYAYCAWNPVKLVDPDGREWDPSALTQEQQNKLNNSVATLCERSPMFKEVYNTLTESDVVYKLQMGPTQDNAPAQYDNSDNSITFRDEAALESHSAFVEEMVHAYQHAENYCEYDASLDFNYEFEAKFIKYIILDGAMGVPGGMENMLLGIMVSDYKCGEDLDYSKATSPAFQSAYKKEANDYAVYNRNNKIGNANYRKATNQDPATLNLLLKLVRP